MAKKVERIVLKKGNAKFNLVGKAIVKDFTFKLDNQSQKSDWIYNQMNLGIECGEDGTIYADMMGGFGSDRQNVCYVHGKKENGNDDFDNKFTIDWEDRFDEDILDTVGELCFITVGLEKSVDGKVVYKKFLSEYDAIQYINDNLNDGDIITVKGNLAYSEYNDNIQVKKNITSICLSKQTEVEKHKATFTQTLLLNYDSKGKIDKETMTIPIYSQIVDYVKTYKGADIKRNLVLPKVFDVKVDKDNPEKVKKFLKLFEAKKGTITSLTVEGKITRGEVNTTEVGEDDIPEDIKELIELGYIAKEDVLNKMVLANGGNGKPEKFIITAPHIKFEGEEKEKKPKIERIIALYKEEELMIDNLLSDIDKDKFEEDNDNEENVDMDSLIDNALDESSDSDDDSWLDNL